ncbi:peptidylprolyl isomerase [Antarcticimicrobium sediminis]|uniref:Parvulin-like PPIase n=1 Tax=Antarcticimicrobium sediminis TaxID=2546227 RepID=A0A4R5EQW8_9RHOB|nr:peptidylprolyl isomerase [Antarcticimicrobium sediminis]TDE37077.1 peptidylprolyl isomerase [Antarcticimicrobium sediminis]
MLKGLTFLPALAVTALMALPALAQEPDADTVVARVNGQDITLGHVIIARTSLPQQYQQLPDEVLYDAIVEQLIQQSALQQAFGTEVPHRVELTLENERRSLLAGEQIETIMSAAASDEDINAAYDAKYGASYAAKEYNASHILVETEDEAKAIRAELEGGADFADLAKEKSTGPSGPNGGELGWFGAGMMVPEFEEAVKTMAAGDISQPVQTQFGWHIVKLNETRDMTPPTLDEVHDEIAGELRQQAVVDGVDALVAEAEVERPEVDGLEPAMIKDLDLLRN